VIYKACVGECPISGDEKASCREACSKTRADSVQACTDGFHECLLLCVPEADPPTAPTAGTP
jgi:hypothetical protein